MNPKWGGAGLRRLRPGPSQRPSPLEPKEGVHIANHPLGRPSIRPGGARGSAEPRRLEEGAAGESGLASEQTPLVIELDIPAPEDTAGGIVVADVNDDGRPDFLVTTPGHLAVYNNSGRKLWIEKTDLVVSVKSETNGLPEHTGLGTCSLDGLSIVRFVYWSPGLLSGFFLGLRLR